MPSWIYKITQIENKECVYIGSTIGKYFCLRKGEHTRPSTTKSGKQQNLYGYIQEKDGWGNFQFEILYQSDVNIERLELLQMEKNYINEYLPKCNKNKPIETRDECNARKRRDQKKWRAENPDYIIKNKNRQSQKDFVKKRCSTKIECHCGGTYTLQNKTNHFSRNIHKKYEETLSKNNTEVS